MAAISNIEWTDATWNPIVGCSVVSPGCTNCYAMRFAGYRLDGNKRTPHYLGTTQPAKSGPVWTGKVACATDETIAAPLRWRQPRRIFVNSMGDIFHESIPDAWIDRVFAIMALAPRHTFQVLTKRAARMRAYLSMRAGDWQVVWPDANPPGSLPISRYEQRLRMSDCGADVRRVVFPLPNVHVGVSAEDQPRADERIPDLRATPAEVRFLSLEPLLGPTDLQRIPLSPSHTAEDCDMRGSALEGHEVAGLIGNCASYIPPIDWVIVGGESGPNARPMHPDWARSLRDQCADAGVPFFFKQWGGPSKSSGRLLDGREHNEMPRGLR